jgi:hypothetical protein
VLNSPIGDRRMSIDALNYMTVDREGPENRDRDVMVESQDLRFLIEEVGRDITLSYLRHLVATIAP